jgi:translation initiation factor IF-1
MSAWGAGLFSSDWACDVRDKYRDLVADGLSGPEATDRLLELWGEALDEDEGPEFWCALAATQWKVGRLEPRVRDHALEVIRTGQRLDRWPTGAQRRARASVLTKLAAQLDSPQRAPVRIRRRFRATTSLVRGDAVTYRLSDGRLALLRVVYRHGDDRENCPIVEVADWLGTSTPDPAGPTFRVVDPGDPPNASRTDLLMIAQERPNEFPSDRVRLVAQGVVEHSIPYPALYVRWDDLEDRLLRMFSITTRP